TPHSSCVLSHIPLPPTSTLFPYTTLFRSNLFKTLENKMGRGLRSTAVGRPLARYPAAHECPARHLRVKTWPVSKLLGARPGPSRSEEHTSELQSRFDIVCRLLLEKKK